MAIQMTYHNLKITKQIKDYSIQNIFTKKK